MIPVFGHLNPDSDAVCSALVAADWLTFTGRAARAYRLGDINAETRFILHAAGVDGPPPLDRDIAGQDVWLVDFSEFEQGPPSLPAANILGIFDHHRLGSVVSRQPPEVWIKPVGASATLIWHIMRREYPMPLSAAQAILLLGAIFSDTVCLTSSTTTPTDHEAADSLCALAGLDRRSFSRDLLAAKTDLTGYTPRQLLEKDVKFYRIGEAAVKIAQIEVAETTDWQAILPGLQSAMGAMLAEQSGLDNIVLMLTDIDRKDTRLYFAREFPGHQQPVMLRNVMSRKKEVLPWLTDELARLSAARR
ncbi:DHHA2 domain-containing protein [Martelella alba]|uniref:inorganic diphosphatase n=1 Tax=Martelella alba TaxID=2590451 RepID=A0ABY2SU26_9HYPH|nr:DHHA2 domain-containing protein [Martelella alba]TKI07844.1 inorganic pyrophosphatase [Martelella alba]